MKFHPSEDGIIDFPVKRDATLLETRARDDSHSQLIVLPGKKRLRLLSREPAGAVLSLTSLNPVIQLVPSIIGIDESSQANLSLQKPLTLKSAKANAYEVFLCYAPEDNRLREALEKHLNPMLRQLRLQQRLCVTLHNSEVGAGKAWKKEIESHLITANIILLLVSVDFLNSDFCTNVEMKYALRRHKTGEACVIPVILRPCIWKGERFGHLQALPKGDKAVTEWSIRDKAFTQIASGVQYAILDLIGKSRTQKMP